MAEADLPRSCIHGALHDILGLYLSILNVGLVWILFYLLFSGRCSPQERAQLFGVVMGQFWFTSAAGPLLGGQITKTVGHIFTGDCTFCHGGKFQAVFVMFFATNVLVVLVILFGFRETAPRKMLLQRRQEIAGSSASKFWIHFVEPTLAPCRLIGRWVAVLCDSFVAAPCTHFGK